MAPQTTVNNDSRERSGSALQFSLDPRFNNVDHRPGERWHSSQDALARRYRDVCAKNCEFHDRAGYGKRMKHIIFGLPAPIIAIVVTCIVTLWDDPESVYLVAPLSALGGIFSAVHTFFDLSGKAQRHWDFSARYGRICSEIDTCLASDIDFRVPPDAFFARTNAEIFYLNANAPQLPGKGCCGCSKYDGAAKLPEVPVTTHGNTFLYVPNQNMHEQTNSRV